MVNIEWILLLTQLPQSPSSVRVTVWRRMKVVGAVSLQSSAWILPNSAKHEQFMREIQSFVQAQSGRAFIFMVKNQGAESESSIMEMFQANIERDYIEFHEGCQGLLDEIKKETKLNKFDFAELDEIEEDLQKLTSWLRKIRARDFFGSQKGDAATTLLEQCRKELQIFEKEVYKNEGLEIPDNET